ncbi:MAG: TauD/TfdA family dioxygenase [Pseudomonadota bacterium]
MPDNPLKPTPLRADTFGACLDLSDAPPDDALDKVLAAAKDLPAMMDRASGLLLIRGLSALAGRPGDMVALARAFGTEVEDIRQTLTAPRFFHPDVAEIMVLSNKPEVGHQPPPRPPLQPDGTLDVQFPAQTNWHTDQSYRRPPPDVTLLFGRTTPPADQGQTLFANASGAYDALGSVQRDRLSKLHALHAMGWVGRTPDDVAAGTPPNPLLPHQMPVRQPLVRQHPVTGRHALYLAERRQLDYVDGPIMGMETGPGGAGDQLVKDLLTHISDPRFVYVHAWQPGDLVIADNRSLLHAATWYDSAQYAREMWRCTVMGNSGQEYVGEAKSWLPADGQDLMQGLEDA